MRKLGSVCLRDLPQVTRRAHGASQLIRGLCLHIHSQTLVQICFSSHHGLLNSIPTALLCTR